MYKCYWYQFLGQKIFEKKLKEIFFKTIKKMKQQFFVNKLIGQKSSIAAQKRCIFAPR